MDELPKTIIHRNGALVGPENTLATLEVSVAHGACWVETDVRLTRDGHAVLIHDDTVDRTTDGKGKVSDLTLADLQSLDAGSWYHSSFQSARIPTLREWVMFCAENRIGINLEIKEGAKNASRVASLISEVLGSCWPTDLATPLISSRTVSVLRATRALLPDCHYAWVGQKYPVCWRYRMRKIHGDALVLNHMTLTPRCVMRFKKSGYKVLAYTVNDAARAAALFEMGVDSVFTDDPGLF